MAWLDVCIYRWVDQHKHVRKVCDPYIHLKWINKNKIIIFQPTHSSSRSQVAEASSSSWGNLPWTGLPSSTGCTHTHIQSNQDNLDTSVNPKCTSVRCGTKSDSPPKIHTDMGRTLSTTKTVTPTRNHFPPLRRYIKTTVNETSLFPRIGPAVLHWWKPGVHGRERTVLIYLHTWNIMFYLQYLEKRHCQIATCAEESDRVNWKLKEQ